MKINDKNIIPFLTWVGGKRWLTFNYSSLFPQKYKTYYEPFVGSGAVFFYLKPKKAVLSDLNEELVNTYRNIRDDFKRIEKELYFHQVNHSKQYYYLMRKRKPRSSMTRAARFIYLNRTCWNGLYRVNLKGEFNVPIGTKNTVILSTDNFKEVSNLLKTVDLLSIDFEDTISRAKEDDFIFIDPPYITKHNINNFRKYNERIFSWNDQIRLRDSVNVAISKGVKVIVCNADHPSIIELYKGLGNRHRVNRKSLLSADPLKRQETTELVFSFNIK